MKKKQLKKLNLKKTVVSELSDNDQSELMGGLSSNRNCTGFLCCDPYFTEYNNDICQCPGRDPYSCPVGGY
ncbi:hypothetical protein EO244_00500 [Ancylomarina salipaludis]|uniref:Uncharacterized protein n=1 Tax=Ancylomarina salipaludis TaxID=2501299 RepID=A0A4Q1JPT5_9BACT|nr:class I lanthipeptide [Ancylomarina salipaludis]RXQ97402.1 hypothetical protein EO244_00500 [Ancylomarina salipaludis]